MSPPPLLNPNPNPNLVQVASLPQVSFLGRIEVLLFERRSKKQKPLRLRLQLRVNQYAKPQLRAPNPPKFESLIDGLFVDDLLLQALVANTSLCTYAFDFFFLVVIPVINGLFPLFFFGTYVE
jgi:hypothetical protein